MQNTEKLDLAAIRAYIREWCGGWDVSDLHQSDRHLIAILAAIERVLAIPKHEIPVLDPPGAFSIQAAQNATLDAVRVALGVSEVETYET